MSELPALPSLEPDLESKVFQHKSLFGLPAYLVEDDVEPQDYERLALLGNATFFGAVTTVLFERFPRHRVGYLSQIRVKLTRGEQLADWSVAYSLNGRLKHHGSQPNLRYNRTVQGDIFAAYVGAVGLQHGIPHTTTTWVKSLIDHLPKDFWDINNDPTNEYSSEPLGSSPPPSGTDFISVNIALAKPSLGDKNSVSLFNELAVKYGEKDHITWTHDQKGPAHRPNWAATIRIKGQVVGEGCASKKPAAREIAAHEALKHLNWIEF